MQSLADKIGDKAQLHASLISGRTPQGTPLGSPVSRNLSLELYDTSLLACTCGHALVYNQDVMFVARSEPRLKLLATPAPLYYPSARSRITQSRPLEAVASAVGRGRIRMMRPLQTVAPVQFTYFKQKPLCTFRQEETKWWSGAVRLIGAYACSATDQSLFLILAYFDFLLCALVNCLLRCCLGSTI